MSYKYSLSLTWNSNYLINVSHPSIDDITWEHLQPNKHLTKLQQLINNTNNNSHHINNAYSDYIYYPEEPATYVYAILHLDNKVELLSIEEDTDGSKFTNMIHMLNNKLINTLYRITIEDNLL